jgi:hypothetical protein
MSEVVESRQSNRAAEDLSDFLLAQKSAYLQALDQGEAQKGLWTISMGNEAGGLHYMVVLYTITPMFLMVRSMFRSRLAGERHSVRVVCNMLPRATDGATPANTAR